VVFRPDAHQSSNICSDDVIHHPDAQLSRASSVRTTRTFHQDLPLCREALNCSSLHTSERFGSTSGRHSRPAMGFLSQTQIWEDRCNRPNDVDSRPNPLIHMASHAFKVQTSRCQPSWSGHGSYLYGNFVH
jgi:hypothetical protein